MKTNKVGDHSNVPGQEVVAIDIIVRGMHRCRFILYQEDKRREVNTMVEVKHNGVGA